MTQPQSNPVDRQVMEADIVCVGFSPATGGFLTTLSRKLLKSDGTPAFESRVSPGMPLQILCYERADDLSYGVSGVVSRARGIKESYPDVDLSQIPLFSPVTHEEVLHLLDPIGASRRSWLLKAGETALRLVPGFVKDRAFRLPIIPSFLHKKGGFVFSLGQFNQWVASQLMAGGLVQIWPGSPVSEALIEGDRVMGVRLSDQGVNKSGQPESNYMPGMDIRASLTVVGDGPVGPVGRQLDKKFGFPPGNHQYEWALGMKAVVDLPADTKLKPGQVIHTLGFPEPEIFGFLYVYPGNTASLGIFVPSWFDNPTRTAYRYLQHWMRHPALWKHLKGASLRSWGAKSLNESGLKGAPYLAGNGYARIGEGSGSTNVLTGSGIDEAWTTGVQLAEAVADILKKGQPFMKDDLEQTYVKRRRQSWVEHEGRTAERARDGFQSGFIRGLMGMAMAGFTGGALSWPGRPLPPHQRLPRVEEYYRGKITPEEIEEARKASAAGTKSLHDALMDKAGWPPVELDGKLLVSHQDALLMGGKVQATSGFADHVVVLNPELCRHCGKKVCVTMCSGQALTPGEEGAPAFDREKCIHCGACLWNCTEVFDTLTGQTNLAFRAGAGGLHSAEN